MPVINLATISLGAMVLIEQWSPEFSRYTRAQGELILSGSAASFRIYGYNMISGGYARALAAPRYTLMIDGVAAATVDVPPGATQAYFTIDGEAFTHDKHELQVVPSVPGEQCPAYSCTIVNSQPAQQTFTPVAEGSYTMVNGLIGQYKWGKAPPVYAPRARPMPPRAYGSALHSGVARNGLHCAYLVPFRWGDTHRPCRDAAGMVSSYSMQPYHFDDMVRRIPRVPLLDGPRSVGTVCMTTHLEPGRNGKWYFCDPWRVGKIAADGTITTLAGYRHNGIAPHWQRTDLEAACELVGDWSEVPAARRGFHELWGMAWDERTLAVNEAAPIPSGETEPPHFVGPVMFVADSQNNRVCKIEFSEVTHGPGKVTEFLTGLSDPWDVQCRAGVLYVSERLGHKITRWDATTGAPLGVVVEGLALATVDAARNVKRVGSLETMRATPCVAPEGMRLSADGTWLYWASFAQSEVRRVNLLTGVVEVATYLTMDDNAKFAKLALGPGGIIAVAMWSNADYGWPQTRVHGGARWSIANSTPDICGMGGGFVYVSAVGFSADGKVMAVGGANEGVMTISRKLSGEAPNSQAAQRGLTMYRERGYHLLHGANGFGYYDLDLPFGEHPDLDAYLSACGHSPQ